MASRKQISQVVKFRNLRNSAGWEIFAILQNFTASLFVILSAPLSFWSMICNAESDLNSLCLNQLDNFGINSLQKLQN